MLEKGDMGVKGREMRIAINVINQGQSSLNVARSEPNLWDEGGNRK